MVGRELSGAYFPAKEGRDGAARWSWRSKDLLVPGAPAGVSFNVRRGEILGFAGLVGAGRTELVTTIFGVTPARAGTMLLDGKPFAPRSPRDAIKRGVYLAPEDRKHHGLVLPMSITENTTLPGAALLQPLGPARPRGRAPGGGGRGEAAGDADTASVRRRSSRSQAATSRRWCSASGWR